MSLIRVVSAVLILAMVLVIPGCFTVDAVSMNRQAQVYMKYGQYEKARDLLERSLEYNFENAASHYWLAVCYENLGGMEARQKAAWNYQQAVSFDPTLEVAQIGYMKALYRNGQEEKSLEATRNYMQVKEVEAAREYIPLIQGLLEEDMVENAIIVVEKASEMDPQNARPYLAMANYYKSQQDKDSEVHYLIKAFKADPYDPMIARRLGQYNQKITIPQPEMFRQPTDIDRELQQLQQ